MALQMTNLTKRFGTKTAVDHLSFSINEPGVYGLIGTNGAGKTTTIRMILGMLPIDEGEVTWDGKRWRGQATTKNQKPGGTATQQSARYGYMPEERGIYMKTKVLEQLVYYGRLRGLGKSDAAAAAHHWLQKLGVAECENVLAEKLSKGNQQKIQLISTLIHDPQLLFLDEPFSGLDPINTQVFHELIQEMAQNGKTIIMSSHQMSTVEEYCREITLLHKGKALVQGNLRQIKAGYGHTKLLLGAPEEACAMALAAGLSVAESRENETVFLLPSADADAVCAKLLQAIVAKGIMPLKFVLSEPTLHEIFIKEVSNVEERGAAA